MKLSQRHATVFSALIGVFILSYVLIKAYSSSFTHDESFTYLNYARETFLEIITFKNWYTNNHILNSLLVKYFDLILGNSELALRLPNIILLLVYMIFSSLLFKGAKPFLRLMIFVLLCTNVKLIDLFGLARGYGLSCGFMLMSLYYYFRYFKSRNQLNASMFHFAALLAILSNFTLLTFYVALLLADNIQLAINNRTKTSTGVNLLRYNQPHIVPFLINGIILYEPIRRLLSYSELNFGGKSGFFTNTVSHLIYNSINLPSLSPGILLLLQLVFCSTVVVSFYVILKKYIARDAEYFKNHNGLVSTNLLLICLSVIIIAQHHILQSDYPIQRFSIFLFPLFIIHFGYLINFIYSIKKHYFIPSVLFVLTALSMINFLANLNLRHSEEWHYDSNTKAMMAVVQNDLSPELPSRVRIGCSWVFEPTINYYIVKDNIAQLLPADRKPPNSTDHYRYVFKHELENEELRNFNILAEYPSTNTILLKRKR